MEIETSYNIFKEVHSGNKEYKDKRWIDADKMIKFIEDKCPKIKFLDKLTQELKQAKERE